MKCNHNHQPPVLTSNAIMATTCTRTWWQLRMKRFVYINMNWYLISDTSKMAVKKHKQHADVMPDGLYSFHSIVTHSYIHSYIWFCLLGYILHLWTFRLIDDFCIICRVSFFHHFQLCISVFFYFYQHQQQLVVSTKWIVVFDHLSSFHIRFEGEWQ